MYIHTNCQLSLQFDLFQVRSRSNVVITVKTQRSSPHVHFAPAGSWLRTAMMLICLHHLWLMTMPLCLHFFVVRGCVFFRRVGRYCSLAAGRFPAQNFDTVTSTGSLEVSVALWLSLILTILVAKYLESSTKRVSSNYAWSPFFAPNVLWSLFSALPLKTVSWSESVSFWSVPCKTIAPQLFQFAEVLHDASIFFFSFSPTQPQRRAVKTLKPNANLSKATGW